jgi:hypothetical protein
MTTSYFIIKILANFPINRLLLIVFYIESLLSGSRMVGVGPTIFALIVAGPESVSIRDGPGQTQSFQGAGSRNGREVATCDQ